VSGSNGDGPLTIRDYIIPVAICMVILSGIGVLLCGLFVLLYGWGESQKTPLWLGEFTGWVFLILLFTFIVWAIIKASGEDGEKAERRSGIFSGPHPQLQRLLWLVVFPVAVAGTGVYFYLEGPSSDLQLRPGEERCVKEQLMIFSSGDSACSPMTHEVISVEKPDFLDYRTEKAVAGTWCNINNEKVDVTACVRASPSAPAGTYKVDARYHFSDDWVDGWVRLIVKVLSSE